MTNGFSKDPLSGNMNYCKTQNNGLHGDLAYLAHEVRTEATFDMFFSFLSLSFVILLF